MLIGKIVTYDERDGRGSLVDLKYYEKGYRFICGGVQAGQHVIYECTDLNPMNGFRECRIIAPHLPEGVRNVNDVPS